MCHWDGRPLHSFTTPIANRLDRSRSSCGVMANCESMRDAGRNHWRFRDRTRKVRRISTPRELLKVQILRSGPSGRGQEIRDTDSQFVDYPIPRFPDYQMSFLVFDLDGTL